MLHRELARHALVQAGHEGDVEAELLAALHHPEQDLVRGAREGDDHLVDVVLGGNSVEVPARPEHGDRQRVVLFDERVLVEEADRLQAELGMCEQPVRREPAYLSGADDQRRSDRLAVAVGLRPRPVQGDAAGGEVDGGERPRANHLRREIRRR